MNCMFVVGYSLVGATSQAILCGEPAIAMTEGQYPRCGNHVEEPYLPLTEQMEYMADRDRIALKRRIRRFRLRKNTNKPRRWQRERWEEM